MSLASTTPDRSPGPCPVCGAEAAGCCARCGWLEWFTWSVEDDGPVLRPMDNMLHAEPFQKFIDAYTPAPGTRIVCDFSNVHYISSAALSKLLSLRKRLKAAEGRIVLRSVHPDLWEVFRVTRLDTYFEVEK
jgi:anti-sigma B factor antagonist